MSTVIDGTTFLRRSLRDEDGKSFHGVGVYRVSTVASAGEASTIAQVRLAMFTALRADAGLSAVLRAPTPLDITSARVFHGEAQTGQQFNYITLGDGAEAEGETTAYDAVGVDDEIVYNIWGAVETPAIAPWPVGHYGVEVIQRHCARVLHGKPLVLT